VAFVGPDREHLLTVVVHAEAGETVVNQTLSRTHLPLSRTVGLMVTTVGVMLVGIGAIWAARKDMTAGEPRRGR
jgi:hypothetical protein